MNDGDVVARMVVFIRHRPRNVGVTVGEVTTRWFACLRQTRMRRTMAILSASDRKFEASRPVDIIISLAQENMRCAGAIKSPKCPEPPLVLTLAEGQRRR